MTKRTVSVQSEIRRLFFRHYRTAESRWVGGENEAKIVLSEKAYAFSRSEKVWHKKRRWSGTDMEATLHASPRWRRSVRDRGLAVLDGLLTTHAGRKRTIGVIEVYPASWVVQGRGLSVSWQSGWLAYDRRTGASYHSPGGTSEKAVGGLRRKMRLQAVPSEERDEARRVRAERRRASPEGFAGRLAAGDFEDLADVEVSREDSLRAGNCEPGTDQFAELFFPGRRSATIAEIARNVGPIDPASLDEDGLTLARQVAAACLAAVRRARKERRERKQRLNPVRQPNG